jgi:hypothetical protein
MDPNIVDLLSVRTAAIHARPLHELRATGKLGSTLREMQRDDMKAAILFGAVLSVVLSNASVAHHSFAMFDNQKEMTLTGTVKELQWTNPHIWVQVMVTDPDTGKEVEWSIEGGSPNNLKRRGWSRNIMKTGDKIIVIIHPLKNGDHGGSLVKATINGTPLT